MLPKILFYTHGLVDGGGERLWSCLASAFKARGYEVLFVQDFEASENRANLDTSIPLATLGKGHLQSVRRLADLLRREQPDVTLSAIGASNIKLLAALALARTPTRPIITYHGYEEWKSGVLSFLTYTMLPLLSRYAARTVAVSTGLREVLVQTWSAAPGKTVTIHNPVFFPAGIAVPTAAELAARDPVVLSVGRLVSQKDWPTLIRAFARVETPGARLVILGKGPEQDKIEALIRSLGIESRVTLAGYSNEPWSYYANAKCFALSSRSEPFGNVIVEALAHGLPAVATACAGPLEILEHGEHGKIVPLGDHVQLAAAIDATLAATGDPASRARRAEDFSFKVRVPAYEALVAEVLAEQSLPDAAALATR